MGKCEHPDCSNNSKHGICQPHLDLILKPSNSVLLCGNCGHFLKVFEKFDPTMPKYLFSGGCRYCSSKEDEKIKEK